MNRSSWNTRLQSRCVWVLEGRSSEPKSPRQRCFSLAPTHSPWNTRGFLRPSTLLMKTKGSFLLMESFRTSLSEFHPTNHPFFHERNHRDQSGILCLIPFATGWAFPSLHFLLQSTTNGDGKYCEKELFGQRGVPANWCPKESVFLSGK